MVPGQHDEQPTQRGIHVGSQAPPSTKSPTSAASVTLTLARSSSGKMWLGSHKHRRGKRLKSSPETRVLHSSGSPAERFQRERAQRRGAPQSTPAEEAGSTSLTRSRAQVHDSGKLAGSTGQLGPRTNKSSNASLTWTSNLCTSWLTLSRNLKAATRRGPTWSYDGSDDSEEAYI